MKKSIATLFLLLIATMTVFADSVKFTANAPKSVVVNQQFRLTYTVNSSEVTEPTIPDIDGFTILVGPSRSSQTSMQSINGRVTYSSSVTFTYILMANGEGDFTLPAATINVNGEKITSNSVKIKVLPNDGSSNTAVSQPTRSGRPDRQSASTGINNEDLFVVATLNKTNVYKQEAVLLTYKVYSKVNLIDLDNPMPDLKKFHTQEVELPQERQFELEHYNGQNYHAMTWRQFVLFPQESGSIEIPPLTFEGLVAVQTQSSFDPFEMMFNGGPSYVEVKRKLKTNKLVLNVKDLPVDKTGNFSGAVGNFEISASLNRQEFKTNEEFSLTIKVKGTGNMKLMGNPRIDFPSDFYVFDPVINNELKLRSSGFTGERVYEYVITPKVSGEHVVPSAQLTYFDTSSDSYKTISTQPITIDVVKGKEGAVTANGTYVAKERGELLSDDIRHISMGPEREGDRGDFYASSFYYILYLIALLLFAFCIVIWRKMIADNADTILVRTKKANKIAVGRLKSAKKQMALGNANGFYDEILKALWGYMGDKLSIPVSQLTKENISYALMERNVDEDIVTEVNGLLNECEFARYAPGDKVATMDKVYKQSIDVISRMENRIRK